MPRHHLNGATHLIRPGRDANDAIEVRASGSSFPLTRPLNTRKRRRGRRHGAKLQSPAARMPHRKRADRGRFAHVPAVTQYVRLQNARLQLQTVFRRSATPPKLTGRFWPQLTGRFWPQLTGLQSATQILIGPEPLSEPTRPKTFRNVLANHEDGLPYRIRLRAANSPASVDLADQVWARGKPGCRARRHTLLGCPNRPPRSQDALAPRHGASSFRKSRVHGTAKVRCRERSSDENRCFSIGHRRRLDFGRVLPSRPTGGCQCGGAPPHGPSGKRDGGGTGRGGRCQGRRDLAGSNRNSVPRGRRGGRFKPRLRGETSHVDQRGSAPPCRRRPHAVSPT